MLSYKNKQFLINGKPSLIMAGEIHYYRLDPSEWQPRIDELKAAGFNTVATYIPWVCHEHIEGDIDLTGKYHPRHNIKAFIELCEKNDLFLFLRPGPFIMAEMKNDGIPHWVYKKYPELIPTGFDHQEATTPTLDYLAPNFLKASKDWYQAIMTLISEHIPSKGGKVIGIQLDNEIGMLSWVSNRPDLTEHVINQFKDWLRDHYDEATLSVRYPIQLETEFPELVRSPKNELDIIVHHDLGLFMRDRFKKYVHILREYAREFGVVDVLYFVNIHGTGGGRGFTYPIGVSQLIETYAADDDILSGSDVYFGDVKIYNFQDIYLCNSITDATNHHGKPLSTLEFNLGDCNFGDNFAGRDLASSNDFKIRLHIAQGNKFLNDYLYCGGTNYRFDTSLGDGNDRIATTGETHGFAAPIGPTGIPNYTYPRMKRVLKQFMALHEKHATSFIDYDPIYYGFIPDYYMTEYIYEHAPNCTKKYRNISENRNIAWESAVRATLLSGTKLGTIDIQNDILDQQIKELILSSSEYMSENLQQKLSAYVNQGGALLLQGQLPRYNELGEDCTILADSIGAKPGAIGKQAFRHQLSIVHQGPVRDFPEYNVDYYEAYQVQDALTLLTVYGTNEVCGFFKEVGLGKVVVLGTNMKCNLAFYQRIQDLLQVYPSLSHDITIPGAGVFMTETINSDQERFLYLINMDDVDKDFNVYRNGEPLFDRKIHLPANDGLTLPLEVQFDDVTIVSSTVELSDAKHKSLIFRNTEKYSTIILRTDRTIEENPYFKITKSEHLLKIETDNRLLDDEIIVNFV
ncbi:MAG: glycosyl hydrolase [Herbinix sp.]|jgi:beta-galactosidase|nr:glycosyl hydrolase [Herbinix sp.]